MVSTWKMIKHFFQSAKGSSKNVLIVHSFMLAVVVPSFAFFTKIILASGNIQYLSYDNFFLIVKGHPFVLLGLFLVLCMFSLVIFFEFTFLLLSIYFIRRKRHVGLYSLLSLTFKQLKKSIGSEIFFFIFYFFLILPFGGIGFKTELLAKIKIPIFILDYIFLYRLIFVPLLLIGYLVCLYIGIRLMFVLPLMIIYDYSFKEAMKEGIHLTKHKFWYLVRRLLFLSILLSLFVAGIAFLLSSLQKIIELGHPEYGLISGVVVLTTLQFLTILRNVAAMVIIFYLIVAVLSKEDYSDCHLIQQVNETKVRRGIIWSGNILIGLFFLFSGVGMGLYNYLYLEGEILFKPLIISHRGVTAENGVQNTVSALERTAKMHPDFVEMDIQETKDHQFVVMHDLNLKGLAGKNANVGELTLAELQKVTISENGEQAKIASFDEYLAAAKRLNQKLLIEIKVSPSDSKDMVDLFVERYKKEILENNYQLQSLSYQVVNDLKEKEPKFYVGYIMPFNLIGPPDTKADFYAVEYSTLSDKFVDQVANQDKEVYVWSINDEATVQKMMTYGVNGVITDDIAVVNEAVKLALNNSDTYYNRLMNYYSITD